MEILCCNSDMVLANRAIAKLYTYVTRLTYIVYWISRRS